MRARIISGGLAVAFAAIGAGPLASPAAAAPSVSAASCGEGLACFWDGAYYTGANFSVPCASGRSDFYNAISRAFEAIPASGGTMRRSVSSLRNRCPFNLSLLADRGSKVAYGEIRAGKSVVTLARMGFDDQRLSVWAKPDYRLQRRAFVQEIIDFYRTTT